MVTGSLQERKGKYTAVLNLYKNGKRKQKSIALDIPVKGNKRKALEMLEELKRQYSGEGIKDLQIKKDSPLFADFLRDWLKITAPTIERTTHQSYESMIKARLDGFFRTLPLIPEVRAQLLETKERQEYHRKLFKKSYDNTYADYVCVDEMGKLFRPNYITDHFGYLLKQYQFRKIRFRDLRHSCASLLLARRRRGDLNPRAGLADLPHFESFK